MATFRASLKGEQLTPAQQSRFLLCVVRLLQDDDSDTRVLAYKASQLNIVEGKAVETTVKTGGDALLDLVLRDQESEFREFATVGFDAPPETCDADEP